MACYAAILRMLWSMYGYIRHVMVYVWLYYTIHMLLFMYGFITHVMVYEWLYYACYGLCMDILRMLWFIYGML